MSQKRDVMIRVATWERHRCVSCVYSPWAPTGDWVEARLVAQIWSAMAGCWCWAPFQRRVDMGSRGMAVERSGLCFAPLDHLDPA